jgi:hypothetical protein
MSDIIKHGTGDVLPDEDLNKEAKDVGEWSKDDEEALVEEAVEPKSG